MRLDQSNASLGYDRSAVRPGVVHIGIGAFFRAHGAVYLDDILARDPRWGVIGVSMRRPDTGDALAPQDFCYAVAVRDGAGTACRTIGSVLDIIDATASPERVMAALTDPSIRIVSLTVTEKGYCHDPGTGALDPAHADIRHDLAAPDKPVSVPGLIARAIDLRRLAGTPPFTVLCCDNLPENGKTAKAVVTGFAALCDPQLAAYIRESVPFPCTMVDRIVPATTDEDRALVREMTGKEDAWPVVTEPFTQWVIEDEFASGRPDYVAAGAQMVGDVAAYELMKLRMLNGSHSTLAYLGYLAGYETVSAAMADADMARLIREMMLHEIIPTLPFPPTEMAGYAGQLIARFANPALKHRTWQIAMDGSQKLPQRLLGTIRDRLATDQPVTRLALGVAAWMRYATGEDERGRPIDVRDPLAQRLRQIYQKTGPDAAALADAYLGLREVFDADLATDASFRAVLSRHLGSLFEIGALATLKRL